jgi:hypothetical protein
MALEIQACRLASEHQSGQVWLALGSRRQQLGHPYGVHHRRPQAVYGVQPIGSRESENHNRC